MRSILLTSTPTRGECTLTACYMLKTMVSPSTILLICACQGVGSTGPAAMTGGAAITTTPAATATVTDYYLLLTATAYYLLLTAYCY